MIHKKRAGLCVELCIEATQGVLSRVSIPYLIGIGE